MFRMISKKNSVNSAYYLLMVKPMKNLYSNKQRNTEKILADLGFA